MAPERIPGPGGSSLPGMSRSAPQAAARTSQTTDSAFPAADDGPSREEVQQRISSLYDRAETVTGNYNATRAMAAGTRGRLNPPRDKGRTRNDAALDDVARPWFDAVRAQLGPSMPARLPADRMPNRPAETRPAPPAARPEGGSAPRALEAAGRPVPELTAGPAAGPVAELTSGRAVAALPAAPVTGRANVKALAAAPAESGHSSLKNSKERSLRKLERARELLSQHVARQRSAAPVAAIEAAPAQVAWPLPEDLAPRQAEQQWQQPTALDTGSFGDTGSFSGMGTFNDTGSFSALDATGSLGAPAPMAAPLGMDGSLGAGMPLAPDMTVAPSVAFSQDMTVTPGAFTPDMTVAPGAAFATDTGFVQSAAFALDPAFAPDPAFASDATLTPGAVAPAMPFAPDLAAIPAMAVAPAPSVSPAPSFVPDPSFVSAAPVHAGAGGGDTPGSGYDARAAKALEFARAQIGRPCVWGAAGPGSYDCAGLTRAAWMVAGVALPRTARDQATAAMTVPLTDLRVGDLVFFYGDVSHVGLYIGNSTMIHAPSPGAYIREESIFYAGQAAIHSAARPA